MGRFRIKVVPASYSSDYAEFRYSTNGIFWYSIYTCEMDHSNDRYYLDVLTVRTYEVELVIHKFKTLEDVERYEADHKASMIERNNRIDQENKRREMRNNEIYKKYS